MTERGVSSSDPIPNARYSLDFDPKEKLTYTFENGAPLGDEIFRSKPKHTNGRWTPKRKGKPRDPDLF
jgi:hypothetical protein